jgi:hypothetical protein
MPTITPTKSQKLPKRHQDQQQTRHQQDYLDGNDLKNQDDASW